MADGSSEVWLADEVLREPFEEGYVEERAVCVTRSGSTSKDVRVFRFTIADGTSAALLLVEGEREDARACLPESRAPRIYREYPLLGSTFLPIEFVLDAKFEPDQERTRVLMGDADKLLLQEALASCVLGVRYAYSKNWLNSHSLARVSKPGTGFDRTDEAETQWWVSQLAALATTLATLPLVECADGRFLPAVSEGDAYADFIVPRLLLDLGEDETSIGRVWPLAAAAIRLCPPRQELAVDWSEIADGWHALGIEVNRITVSELAKWVRDDVKLIDELLVEGDPCEWLARFLDVVGECWSKRAGVEFSAVSRMLPNQNRRLCSHDELRIDDGISSTLKGICLQMGRDVRDQLLLSGFDDLAKTLDLTFLDGAIKTAITTSMTETAVIDEAIRTIQGGLPEDKDYNATTASLQTASIWLASYLWESQGMGGAPLARQIPLLTARGRAARWSPERLMMAPVCTWAESAREFSNAYPPTRVLADIYGGDPNESIPNTVTALVNWGIAIADPLTSDTPVELKDRRLAAMSTESVDGIVVGGQAFSQIALLQPEVLNRCQDGREEARALLGLVLRHIAVNDPEWETERSVQGRKAGSELAVRLNGALWLADLKFRVWVPVLVDDKFIKMPANATTLTDLLDPAWLDKNDAAVRLLSKWFGFDELELRLLGTARDAQTRLELRNGLAKLVESAGADPAVYASLAADLEAQQQRKRDVARCQRFGIAVQEAVKSAIERYGFDLKLIDRGFDYEVTPPASVLEDASTKFEVGPHLLEVKATTSGGARLTPMQAATAARESSRTSYVSSICET
jgi:hypothetical protein